MSFFRFTQFIRRRETGAQKFKTRCAAASQLSCRTPVAAVQPTTRRVTALMKSHCRIFKILFKNPNSNTNTSSAASHLDRPSRKTLHEEFTPCLSPAQAGGCLGAPRALLSSSGRTRARLLLWRRSCSEWRLPRTKLVSGIR